MKEAEGECDGTLVNRRSSFEKHVNKLVRSCYYCLRNIARICSVLCFNDTQTKPIILAFITSRLDDCNGVLTGMTQKAINRLQIVQNALLTRTKKSEHITPV